MSEDNFSKQAVIQCRFSAPSASQGCPLAAVALARGALPGYPAQTPKSALDHCLLADCCLTHAVSLLREGMPRGRRAN